MPVKRSNDARERAKQKKADLATMKAAVIAIIHKVEKMNRQQSMSAGLALEIVTQEIRKWRH